MGFTKALFYPTIDIPNDEWLKSAVLFWDQLNTIVPSSIKDPYEEDTTRYLYDEGILKPVKVNPDDDFVAELANDTLNYLNTNEGFQLITQGKRRRSIIHRDKMPRDVSNLFDIHPEKLPHEIQHQLRRNLSRNGSFQVDTNFARFYMTLLANKICEKKNIALLTDNALSSNLSDKARLDNQIVIKGRDYYDDERSKQKSIHLAQGLLTNLIIEGVRIKRTSSLVDIIDFKKHHKDELGLFRTNISKLTQNVSKDLPFEAMKQQIEDIYNDEFLPAYNAFKKALKSSGIKWAADNFMKVSFFSTTGTALPMTLLGLALPHALLAGVGVSLVTSAISYNEDKKEKLRNNPYSYLLAVERQV